MTCPFDLLIIIKTFISFDQNITLSSELKILYQLY